MIRILSLNCYCFPWATVQALHMLLGIDLHSRVKKSSTDLRIAGISKYIRQFKPDIICFQELWKIENKNLMKSLLPTYIDISDTNTGWLFGIGVDSGLLTLVNPKFSVISSQLYTYKNKGHSQSMLANKGAQITHLRTSSQSSFIIINTHLDTTETRYKQMEELANMFEIKFSGKQHHILLCGDFNTPITIDQKSKKWNDTEVHKLSLNRFRVFPSTDKIKDTHTGTNLQNTPPSIIDHIFTSNPNLISKYSIYRKDLVGTLTDHAVTIVDFDIDKVD